MSDQEKTGYCRPPTRSRWKKGQSGNPDGRPKSRKEILADAAAILAKPISAQTHDGRKLSLDAFEASYLALCRKGLKGHKQSLMAAIHIMLDVGVAAEAAKQDDLETCRIIDEMDATMERARGRKGLVMDD